MKNSKTIYASILIAAIFFLPRLPKAAETIDLSTAVIVSPANASIPETKAISMLKDEVEKRTWIKLPCLNSWPDKAGAIILAGVASSLTEFASQCPFADKQKTDAPEGYRIWIDRSKSTPVVIIAGNDARGLLFGVGRLLRKLHITRNQITLDSDINVNTAPKYPIRGHQLGYRPKTNAYDGWNLTIWEQYIRDLTVFGTNAIELIPPRSDDDADSPHFPRPPLEMMTGMSQIAKDYNLDVWIWYPALDKDYADPKTVEFALNEWGAIFKQLPRIDAILVPCGDPGSTPPELLMPMLEKQTASLHRYHPKAQMWVAPQGFNQERLEKFFSIIETKPAWLTGIVFGPQVRIPLPELRKRIPAQYPIRHYPDITHSSHCQYPVPDWDRAFAITEGRETINPRPAGFTKLIRVLQPNTIGFITYSEGCNDDVNKIVWSALGWNPDADTIDILRDYSRYFIGESYSDSFAQGLAALETNWQSPVLINKNIDTVLQQFQEMERSASPQVLTNWRFQMGLYRAYYDAYIRSRLIYETSLEEQALAKLREASAIGSKLALDQAETILNQAITNRVSPDLRNRIAELAEGLFQSIHMQLSVKKYQAVAINRGANLDRVDFPVNNRLWLLQRFNEIRQTDNEPERLAEIFTIADWSNPGPGGFYDDLGNAARQPHLLRGKGFDKDPGSFETTQSGFGADSGLPAIVKEPYKPISWWDNAMALYEAPLEMHYPNLDPTAEYKIRVVYTGGEVQLQAGHQFEIHPYINENFHILEFDIPQAATAGGELTLTWKQPPGIGGTGRGNQVGEIWLIKKSGIKK